MKFIFFVALIAALNLVSYAQGQFQFQNRIPSGTGSLLDAPVFDVDCQTRIEGPRFVGQVYAGGTPASLQPIEPVTVFGSGARAGYLGELAQGIFITMPGHVGLTYVQLRAWERSSGPTYEDAARAGGKHGFSNISTTFADVSPGPPGLTLEVESFCLIPEPRTWAMGFIGAIVAWACWRPRNPPRSAALRAQKSLIEVR